MPYRKQSQVYEKTLIPTLDCQINVPGRPIDFWEILENKNEAGICYLCSPKIITGMEKHF